jgi:uncharacterized DUF497 family protein
MQLEFDPEKDRLNLAKHGIFLAAAAEMDLETVKVIPDERYRLERPASGP